VRRLLLLLLMLTAVGAWSSAADAATIGITINKTGFSPQVLTVAQGDTVTWTNRDTASHKVVADNGVFTSPTIAPGQSWSFTFTKADFYAYRDAMNEAHRGTVSVNAHGGVTIAPGGFRPAAVAVAQDEAVTWTNRDTRDRQVVADNGSFVSPVLKPGQTYSHTFDTPGSVSYHDGLHPTQKGRVDVAAGPPVFITMRASSATLISGASLLLSGTVSTGRAGDTVNIIVQPFGFPERVMTVTTGTGGSFSVRVSPHIGTTYRAQLKTVSTGSVRAESPALTINVRPRVSLRRVASNRFSSVVISAANPIAGHYLYLTRWVPSRHAWITIAKARLVRTSNATVNVATFRVRLAHRLKLRAVLPALQAGPGYLTGYSNFISS
jgi:plastocyanin